MDGFSPCGWTWRVISSLSKYVTIFMPRQAFHPNNECPPAYSQVIQCCHCCFCWKDFFLFLQGIALFQCIPASCSPTPCCEVVWLQTFVTNLAIGWAEISLVILMSAAVVPTISSRLCVFFSNSVLSVCFCVDQCVEAVLTLVSSWSSTTFIWACMLSAAQQISSVLASENADSHKRHSRTLHHGCQISTNPGEFHPV